MKVFISVSALIIILEPLFCQTPTIQDCVGAIPVCTEVYSEEVVSDGFGLFMGEVNSRTSCLVDDRHAIWYTFTVNSSGDFGFVLTPNDPDDDYDWGLWDLTNNACSDIVDDISFLWASFQLDFIDLHNSFRYCSIY